MGLKSIFKLKPKNTKNIRPVLGGLCILFGMIFMLVPFIPLGYILLFGGIFLLAPYIPVVDKLLKKIKNKDDKNRVQNAQNHVSHANDKISEKMTNEETGNSSSGKEDNLIQSHENKN